MVDRHLVITRTPSDGIEFSLAHSLGPEKAFSVVGLFTKKNYGRVLHGF
jgi:hypothetical protein